MKNALVILLLACLAKHSAVVGQDSSSLPRSTPEAQGVSSSAILQFVEAANKIDAMHSFMLVRHGHVIAEGWWGPYSANHRHELYSLSKSFTSTAVGLAIAEGKLNLDDPVLKFFPEDGPAEPSKNLKEMTVRNLLSMSAGHQSEAAVAASKQPWTKTFLAQKVPFKPGTHFLYNTPATYMLSAIVQKVTGQTVLEYLQPRLFEPLGIREPTWGTSPQGISLGGYGLSVRTEDIARFGQLYLQKGKWGDKQLVPASWIEQATSKQVSNGNGGKSDWAQGYGFQFWRSRHGCYRGDGAFGQFCLVMPEQDAVLAITSGVKDMQGILNLVWDKLLPAMQSTSLPADAATHSTLQKKLASLTLPVVPVGSTTIPMEVLGKKYTFPANDQKIEVVALEKGKSDNQLVLLLQCNGGKEQRVAIGSDNWLTGRLSYSTYPDQAIALNGAWTSKSTYTLKVCFNETPFILTLNLDFDGNQLKLNGQSNVGFGNTKQKQLIGEAK